MNTNINDKQNKDIPMQVLCALAWINAVLAGVLIIQQQTAPQLQAYLIGRTPADFAITNQLAYEPVPTTVVELPTSDTTPITESSASSDKQVILTVPSSVSSASVTPYIDTPSVQPASSSAQSEQTHAAAPVIEPVVSSASSESSDSSLASSSTSSISVPASTSSFPAFGNAVMPITEIPNWGAMKTPAEWNRSYSQMTDNDFVKIPSYDLKTLTIPVKSLEATRDDPKTIDILTDKLFYSTRYFGAYDIDATEFSAVHPGIDLKLAEGTPVGAVAGGRVHDVRHDENSLGIHVIIEHRAPDGSTFYSIYGHLGSASVKAGDIVTSGQMIGVVGMTGNTSGPHLHLQIDRGEPNEDYHSVYWPAGVPSSGEASKHVINPIAFIRQY